MLLTFYYEYANNDSTRCQRNYLDRLVQSTCPSWNWMLHIWVVSGYWCVDKPLLVVLHDLSEAALKLLTRQKPLQRTSTFWSQNKPPKPAATAYFSAGYNLERLIVFLPRRVIPRLVLHVSYVWWAILGNENACISISNWICKFHRISLFSQVELSLIVNRGLRNQKTPSFPMLPLFSPILYLEFAQDLPGFITESSSWMFCG